MQNETRQNQSGHTLIEVSIVAVITVFLMTVLQGGVLAVSRTTQVNDQELREQARRNDVLEQVRADLIRTGIDRVSIEDGGATLRFPLLIGAAVAGGEVNGSWSSDVVISWDPNSESLVRRQDGGTVLLGIGVTNFNATRDDLELEVTCETGGDADAARTVRVRPRN